VLGYVPWEGKNEFKRNISIVLGQKNQLWWDLPANESLYLNKCIYDISDKDYRMTLDELSELLEVKELLDVQVRNLSLGERMKMELLAALLHKPKVIFLDEPTIGLDIIAQKNIRDFLKYYNTQEKITIMLTSHYLEDIEALCQRTIVINNGSLVYDGKIESISEEDIPLEESLEILYRTR
jgi:ABC-2 type transport system ATP-binding protein